MEKSYSAAKQQIQIDFRLDDFFTWIQKILK